MPRERVLSGARGHKPLSPQPDSARQAALAAHSELVSVVDPRAQGQETPGSCAAGKRATRAAVGVLLAGRYDSQTETLPQNAPFGQ